MIDWVASYLGYRLSNWFTFAAMLGMWPLTMQITDRAWDVGNLALGIPITLALLWFGLWSMHDMEVNPKRWVAPIHIVSIPQPFFVDPSEPDYRSDEAINAWLNANIKRRWRRRFNAVYFANPSDAVYF